MLMSNDLQCVFCCCDNQIRRAKGIFDDILNVQLNRPYIACVLCRTRPWQQGRLGYLGGTAPDTQDLVLGYIILGYIIM
jgi:hypothetical protein